MKRRLRVVLEYDGTAYAGWQRQINAPSVQQTVEEALGKLIGEPCQVTAASRTDAGVHATGQVFHFDTQTGIPGHKLAFALNTFLPNDIRAVASANASPSFHARYHACGKTYRYYIHNAPHASAIHRNLRAHVPLPLNVEAMKTAAAYAVGTHDFSAMCATGGAARDSRRTITEIAIQRADSLIEISVSGDGFLYNMVRILAGTLIEIGLGRLPENVIETALKSGIRKQLGYTAPAHGLCLAEVHYPFDIITKVEEEGK